MVITAKKSCMRKWIPGGFSPNLGLAKLTIEANGAQNTAGIIIYFAFCQFVIEVPPVFWTGS